ncbi:MAG: hypothetical protein HY925_08770 [Elusimicrobia bacterium]|nr:hypothetical protein [Elusimicrobiota bacterium]
MKRRVERAADARGISLGAYLREALVKSLTSAGEKDPLIADSRIFTGKVPANLSAEHDRHLYGE